ncbi:MULTISPECIES: heme exporter protein CcmD [unclassified Chelatococcus]|jgi:heme exporter protein D|uniref:heme exporter protein CcmD n=1 Tax=unclassified Chelatococcus TaxID=2638111 RepID=UPI001BCB00FD|nr:MULTISPECIES: heme exporter protein CcmD [unclassified Chelatococcus]CAH1657902.1 Heme exporter protein D [Hyphomicrobiales bacterium]MBS7740737.1 heme exporter protein CcmD [Chelatococcus sp. HY11]MBX3546029.1 heme exporter protein CcmD [Chelatococcus sp.]MCO5079656.1 heme exporter protein CcmD [Chelatococcus sp.]CAH1684296.1 Heme exporter protein D [Hyphomicrobiales bacterium]
MIALDAPHIGFVLAAYGAAAVIVTGLVLRAVMDSRMQHKALDALAARGVARNRMPSSGHPPGASAVRDIGDSGGGAGHTSSARDAANQDSNEGKERGAARSHNDGRSDRH